MSDQQLLPFTNVNKAQKAVILTIKNEIASIMCGSKY